MDPRTQCDTYDTMLTKVNFWQARDRQSRFLEAYRRRPAIAPAARLAGIHRATVYRWLSDPAFADQLRGAEEAFFKTCQAKVLAATIARRAWRESRERQRHSQRCLVLARARAIKRAKNRTG